jgi:hypothetical protein
MKSPVEMMAKLATVDRVLKAAIELHKHGLIDNPPHDYVRRYIDANPDLRAWVEDKLTGLVVGD